MRYDPPSPANCDGGSRLSRVSERLAALEEQTHQEKRYAEELKAAADDLLGRLEQ